MNAPDLRVPTSHPTGERPPHFDAAEWTARLLLAACYRIVAHLGWTELIYNHITLRLPSNEGAPAQFLINPFGLHYSEVTASNLVRIDLEGRVVENPAAPERWPVNPAGFTVHAAIHRAIPGAHADEGPRLVANIGDRPAVILRNHGLLAWGDTVPRTLGVLWLLNRACEIQVASQSIGPVIENGVLGTESEPSP